MSFGGEVLRHLRAATDTLLELAAIYFVILLLAGMVFMLAEGQPLLDSIYWAGTTATSTGYGDIAPKTWIGRLLALGLMHLSIFGIAPLIVVRLIDRMNEDRDAFTHEEQQLIAERLERIEAMLQASDLTRQAGAQVNSD
jgi:voltage-gated potassium channel